MKLKSLRMQLNPLIKKFLRSLDMLELNDATGTFYIVIRAEKSDFIDDYKKFMIIGQYKYSEKYSI